MKKISRNGTLQYIIKQHSKYHFILSHTSSINLPSNNEGVTFRAMPTPFFSVTILYHALPSLPHCATFKHLNYNLTTYSTLTHFNYNTILHQVYLLLSHTLHPFSIFIQYSHTNSYYTTFNSPPSWTHQHDQIHPSTSSSGHIIHIAQHTDTSRHGVLLHKFPTSSFSFPSIVT